MIYSKPDRYKHKRQLQQMSVGTDTGSVELHNGAETPVHLTMKTLLALHRQRRERPWNNEVPLRSRGCGRGTRSEDLLDQ